MGQQTISGIKFYEGNRFLDERGRVGRIVSEAEQIIRMSDVYYTTVNPGAVKGWHGYYKKRLLYTCVHGNVRLALNDNRPESPTFGMINTFYIGEHNQTSVYIPPGVLNGFKGISQHPSIVVVVADMPYSEEGIFRIPIHAIDYDWSRKDE